MPNQEKLIPKRIHHLWINFGKNKPIPDEYIPFIESWKNHHPDWEFFLWDDAKIHHFLVEYFPDWVNWYNGLSAPILKCDAIRWFILYIYGGVYADTDLKCFKSLECLRHFDFVAPWTNILFGYNNCFLMSQKKSVFLKHALEALQGKRWCNIKNSTIATAYFAGPMFLNKQIKLQTARHPHWNFRSLMRPKEVSIRFAHEDDAVTKHTFIRHESKSEWGIGKGIRYDFLRLFICILILLFLLWMIKKCCKFCCREHQLSTSATTSKQADMLASRPQQDDVMQ